MKLFDEIPTIVGEKIVLRPLEAGRDEKALEALSNDTEVYRFLPTFLFEQKYSDKTLVIGRHYAECVAKKESILLAVCLVDAPEKLVGIGEIYNYEAEKEKASIGYRLARPIWGKGVATEVTRLLKNYLLSVGVRKITAHVMTENAASKRVLEKNGFILKWRDLSEDWGRESPVIVDKFIFKVPKTPT